MGVNRCALAHPLLDYSRNNPVHLIRRSSVDKARLLLLATIMPTFDPRFPSGKEYKVKYGTSIPKRVMTAPPHSAHSAHTLWGD
jgi:hypothetical protein